MEKRLLIPLKGADMRATANVSVGRDSKTVISLKCYGGELKAGANIYAITPQGTRRMMRSGENYELTAMEVYGLLVYDGVNFLLEGQVIGAKIDMEIEKRNLRIKSQTPKAPAKETPQDYAMLTPIRAAEEKKEQPVFAEPKIIKKETVHKEEVFRAGGVEERVGNKSALAQEKCDCEDVPVASRDEARVFAGEQNDEGKKQYVGRIFPLQPEKAENELKPAAFVPLPDMQPRKNSSKALLEILEQADMLFNKDAKLTAEEETDTSAYDHKVDNPFFEAYPNSQWKRVYYPGTKRYYLEGRILDAGEKYTAHAIPGPYSPTPPMGHKGFTKYAVAADGTGYWLRLRRSPAGQKNKRR